MKGPSPPSLLPQDTSSPPPELDALGDRIAELSAHIQAATYRLLTLIREFDRREGWAECGARSCAHWLSWRTGLDLGAAREKVRVARALVNLSKIGGAMSRGELSYSKVRALTRVATPENEDELLRFAFAGTVSHVERLVRAWRRTDRLEECEEDERKRQHRYLQSYTDEDGMLVIRARLEPEAGAALLRALDAAVDRLCEARKPAVASAADTPAEDETTFGQMRADALTLVAESALGGGLDSSSGSGDRYQVVVHVDEEALVEGSESGHSALQGGQHVSAETSRRLACDAGKVIMRHRKDGRMLDVGRKTRTVPPSLRRALAFRDRGCRFPGCDVSICDAHHIRHWADGGKTALDNLLLLCRRHHTAVHQQNYKVLLRADGTVSFHRPNGSRIPDAPRPPDLSPDPVADLRGENSGCGLSIGSRTGLPTGDGEPWDLAWAVEAFRALEPARAHRTPFSFGRCART